MSLKRKASFSAAPSSPFAPMSCEVDMVDSSKHLHSRTRKRFRDGRPDDEVVYGKLFVSSTLGKAFYQSTATRSITKTKIELTGKQRKLSVGSSQPSNNRRQSRWTQAKKQWTKITPLNPPKPSILDNTPCCDSSSLEHSPRFNSNHPVRHWCLVQMRLA